MKKNKAFVIVAVLFIITVIAAAVHLNTRNEVPEGAIEVVCGEESYTIDITKLTYSQVTGTRVNGKGEEKEITALGILLKDVLAKADIEEYESVSVSADDSYSALLTAEEINDAAKTYLIKEEGEVRLRLIVFGDKDSKRSVSNVVQITVNN